MLFCPRDDPFLWRSNFSVHQTLTSKKKNVINTRTFNLQRRKYGRPLPNGFTAEHATLPMGRLHMTSHISRQKKWLTKRCNLCWKGIGRTLTFGVILKTIEKLIKNWNELLLVESLETNKLNKSNFVEIRFFSWLV